MRRPITHLAIGAVVALMALVGVPAVAEEPSATPSGALMVVLSASSSMADSLDDGRPRADAARDALTAMVDDTPDDQPLGLRVYGATPDATDPCVDSQRVVDLGADDRGGLTDALAAYQPVGEAPLAHALQEAALDVGETGQRSILLVADGSSTCDPDPCETARQLRAADPAVRIDVVGLGVEGEARDRLVCVATAGGGSYTDARDTPSATTALATARLRATRPFDLTGAPVVGAPTPEAAATLTAPGRHLDTLAVDDGRWYAIDRTVDASTVHVGLAHESSAPREQLEQVEAKLYADAGQTVCDETLSSSRGSHGFAALDSWQPDTAGPCATADRLFLFVRVSRDDDGVLAGTPLEIDVYEEPPLSGDAPAAPAAVAWTPLEPAEPVTDVTPGSGDASAPVVEDGTYSFVVSPGQTQVVAVPLDWGQSLQAQFDGAITDEHRDGDFERPDVQILAPLRQPADDDLFGAPDDPEDWTSYPDRLLYGTEVFRIGAQTAAVGYAQRSGDAASLRGAALPGLRYVHVSYPADNDAPLAYTLTLRTNGTAGEGAPDYDTATLPAPRPDADLTVAPTATPDDGRRAKTGEASDGSHATALLLGLAGLASLGGAGFLLRRSGRLSR
ncbi:MAG: VWA domain-containing protein [Aeromicrobium sp.]|uniref:hypothetical protein n=1 Tax=Aeromicrobium sp. TaxID=1871063 RepID=UPI0039E2A4FC